MTQLQKFDRITVDPARCFGKPCIRELRLPVHSLLSYLAGGMTEAQVLAEWPELEAEDIRQALAFAAWATAERVLEFKEPAA
jgi:uncharacterized protein (DUF433 family)